MVNDNLEAQANTLFDKKCLCCTEMLPIKSFGTVITGKTPPTAIDMYYGNDIPFIKTPDMHDSMFITTSESSLSKCGADSQANKYIPEKSVVVACIGANAGVVSITAFLSQTNQQINSIVTEYPCFLYFSIKSHTAELRALGDGSSTMINVNKTSFENYLLPTPNKKILSKIEVKLDQIFKAILCNSKEIDKLKDASNLLITQLSH